MDQPVNRAPALDADVPVDRLVLQLRAYVKRIPKPKKTTTKTAQPTTAKPKPKIWQTDRVAPPPWVLVFDCETTTTPDQRLRFGAYQLRYKDQLWESGLFYEPDACTADEQAVLAQVCEEERLVSDNGLVFLRTRAAFVDEVFYKSAFLNGAQIVGFNLPFDLSRIAIGWEPAQRGMKGGFSLKLSPNYPNVAVRHLSQKSAFIQFVGTDGRTEQEDDIDSEAAIDQRRNPDRGYFVDLKTLAATLTSHTGSLASLTVALGVKTIKQGSDDHGEEIKPAYVRYGLRDVQSTWECFKKLSERLAALELPDTGAYELYSEASLGKAYLRAMNVATWRTVQPDFPPAQIGQILSGYFGGRSEVRIRRQVSEVLHCDFLSMYPTVCTLMGLWSFVRSTGVTWRDDTRGVRAFVGRCTAATLQTPKQWPELTAMVQVLPDRDLFPVRAVYRKGDAATIGLNYLTADEPMWFTLADVLAAKILTGKTPRILKAVRYSAMPAQARLKPVAVAGAMVDPAGQDFYASLIDHRQVLKDKEKAAASDAQKESFGREQLAVKTLANATSYGIFVELNVEDYTDNQNMIGHGAREGDFPFRGKKHEKPGRYFHPLLGAMITGAARLMLALAEHQVVEQGLDWAFCDTDSLAIANTAGLSSEVFRNRALAVTEWFGDLNPYAQKFPILQVEDYNYGPVGGEKEKLFEPLFCFAVSAKRYALFNRGADGEIIIRKASGHGLGHLRAPYDEDPEARRERIKRVGVPRWEEDLWREIIQAADQGHPDQVSLDHFEGYDTPAASQYAATSPRLLKWFDQYNKGKSYAHAVKPFGFLLSLQVKSDIELAGDDNGVLVDRDGRAGIPRAAAPYFKRPADAAAHAFDRRTGKPIAADQLKSLGRSLVFYHLHPEGKFHGGDYDERGIMRRRHVYALAFQAIGKEADNIEAQEFVQDDDGPIVHPLVEADRIRLVASIEAAKAEVGFSDRDIAARARGHHLTLVQLRVGGAISLKVVRRFAEAAEELRQEHLAKRADDAEVLKIARDHSERLGGAAALAREMGVTRQYVGRVLNGKRDVTAGFRARLTQLSALDPAQSGLR
jgi:hypothetical protein